MTSALLSKREKECVYFLSHGCTDRKIANRLNIFPRTVEAHLVSAKRKLNIATRAELMMLPNNKIESHFTTAVASKNCQQIIGKK